MRNTIIRKSISYEFLKTHIQLVRGRKLTQLVE
jgi:hypothetical protein